jgi:DNA-binding MarR family transcriptional regulator
VTLNQNQIATLLGLDRTVVHRTIKLMAREGLVSERKANSGKAIHIQLTAKGNRYREQLIRTRVAADETVRQQMTPEDRETLLRLLRLVAECEL